MRPRAATIAFTLLILAAAKKHSQGVEEELGSVVDEDPETSVGNTMDEDKFLSTIKSKDGALELPGRDTEDARAKFWNGKTGQWEEVRLYYARDAHRFRMMICYAVDN